VIFITGGLIVNSPHSKQRDSVNKIFGDPLAEGRVEDPEPRSPEEAAEHDRWLRDNVPPHHD
jgi:hypothetical protein